jgi:predicted DNA-binding antitoxin AbrB/MazE fold protein
MVHIVEAIYEQEVLHPVQPLSGITEHSRVTVTVELKEQLPHPLADCIGILPDEDAEEMLRIIEDEFEKGDT